MLIEKVHSVIKESKLVEVGDRILVCVSGGVDSMVLLDVLSKLYEGKVAVAHCNFGLRGDEADMESQMVINHCENRGVKCYVARFDTVEQRLSGESVQMAARRIRYEFFYKVANDHKYNKIAIGHNFDDKIETFFINITRSCGLKGLQSIAKLNGMVIRPLLSVTRCEITKYAVENKIEYLNDSSNDEDKYLRNKIRHHVIPLLRQTSCFDKAMETVFRNLNDQYQFLEDCVEQKLKNFNLQSADKYIVFRYLEQFGFSSDVAEQVYRSAQSGEVSKRFYSISHVVLLDRKKLIVEPIEALEHRKEDEMEVSYEDVDAKKKYVSSVTKAYFDADKIKNVLRLRKIENGDWFVPFGMTGRRKVNDFLKDLKMDMFSKKRQQVLWNGTDIVWVVGLRTDDRFKIDASTKRVLKVKLIIKSTR